MMKCLERGTLQWSEAMSGSSDMPLIQVAQNHASRINLSD
jgi:hypothetical protein